MKQPPIYIVMNRHIVAENRKLPRELRKPAVRVTRGKHGKPIYCDSYLIHGPSQLLNGLGEAVLPCGATMAIFTLAAVTLTVERRLATVDLP